MCVGGGRGEGARDREEGWGGRGETVTERNWIKMNKLSGERERERERERHEYPPPPHTHARTHRLTERAEQREREREREREWTESNAWCSRAGKLLVQLPLKG